MSTQEEIKSDAISDALMARRTVVLSGKICRETVDPVGKRLLTLQARSNDPIYLIIDSGGGYAEVALNLCDLIDTLLTAPVKGVVFGRCGSAATFVLLHCTERLGARYSHYFIHSGMRNEISLPINQVTSSDDLEHLLKESERWKKG